MKFAIYAFSSNIKISTLSIVDFIVFTNIHWTTHSKTRETNMEKIKVAFATDNGENFIDRHFGDAKFYDIYEINKTKFDFLKRLHNTVEEKEEVHADPQKAKGITELLKNEGVKIVVSKIFGPNIKRIKKKFLCIIMDNDTIDESLLFLCKKTNTLLEELEKGEERNHLVFRK